MDLYADLSLAKGVANAALDADGKPKTSTGGSSVWASTPLMVPQVMRGAKSKAPTVSTGGIASMVPTAAKKPPARGLSITFKPAAVSRRGLSSTTSLKPTTATNPGPAATLEAQPAEIAGSIVSDGQKRAVRVGLGLATVVTEVRRKAIEDGAASTSAMESGGSNGSSQFFTATYRDEYHPSRPNSYEAYCEQRLNRKKLEQVKRELDRRQRQQEEAGKLEREQLAKDLEEGRAPAIELPAAAGRGRGMTMPAWMRKKIESSADKAGVGSDSEHVVDTAVDGQFDDAAPRTGLGFSRPDAAGSITASREDRVDLKPVANGRLDEFGRVISPSLGEHSAVDHRNKLDARERSRDDGEDADRSAKRSRATRSGWDQHTSSRPPSLTGRVVLLQNMVGPGEVDDELQDEVREECTEKYGAVDKCVVMEVTGRPVSAEEAVRIFVKFNQPANAQKAVAGLSGRFFGGRKVRAGLFDEAKFDRMELMG